MPKQLKKTVLVTGASSGIGAEFVKQLAKKGADLILVSRSEKKLAEMKSSLEKEFGIKVNFISADLSKPGEPHRVYQECKKQGLAVDILINNAGVGLFGASTELNEKDVEAMLELNIVALTTLCSLFGRDMKLNQNGMILNVGSVVGGVATPFFASYAASKSYVLSYSLALRKELKSSKVSVTCLAPGFVRTQFDQNAGVSIEKYKNFSESNAMNPDRVASIGLKALLKKKAFTIAGTRNKITAFFTSLLPKTWSTAIVHTSINGMFQK